MENTSNEIKYVIDTSSTFSFHEVFNLGLLYYLQKSSKVIYLADFTAIDNLKRLIEKESIPLPNLEFQKLNLKKGNSSFSIFLRQLLGAFISVFYIFKFRKSDIYITQLNPFFSVSTIFWKMLGLNRVFIVCHGELEYLIKKPKFYKPLYIYKMGIKLFFRFFNRGNTKLIIIGDSIKQNLIKLYPNIAQERLLIFDHPYIFSHSIPVDNAEEKIDGKLKIGLLGSISKEKGSEKLEILARNLKNEILDNKVEFQLIGFNPHFKNSLIKSTGDFMTFEKFNENVSEIDIILFLYGTDSYTLTASGAFFDPIKHCKPVVSLKNDYFWGIIEKYGQIGYLGNDLSSIENKLRQLIDAKSKGKILFNQDIYNNMNNIRDNFSFKTVEIKCI